MRSVVTGLVGAVMLFLASMDRVRAANAESLTGFYYTGESSTGGVLSYGANTPSVANSGTQDPYWTVTYASTNGGSTEAAQYEGTSYVVNATNSSYTVTQVPSWAASTSSAEWITAPGAVWTNSKFNATSGAINSGGDGLPGAGIGNTPPSYTAGNSDIYVYTTTFTIGGNGTTGAAVSGLTMTLSISADNNFAVFVNPANPASALATSTANYVSPANTYTASPMNVSLTSGFVIGVNTISIEVQNEGSATGAAQTNYSGLIVYGSDFVGLPEIGTWLPVAAAVALYAAWCLRRSRRISGAARN